MNEDDKLCSKMLNSLRKGPKRKCLITGRETDDSLTNEEWDFLKKCGYYERYFAIPEEYFLKIKSKI